MGMRPPQHSATAAIRVVPITDPAWDSDRIMAERKAAVTDDESNAHPCVAYWSGRTRFDLDAPAMVGGELRKPSDYFKPGERPVIWRGRRLKVAELARAKDMGGDTGRMYAFAIAYQGAENVPPDFEVPEPDPTTGLSERHLERIAERFGGEALFEIGAAFIRASEAPSQAEKKH